MVNSHIIGLNLWKHRFLGFTLLASTQEPQRWASTSTPLALHSPGLSICSITMHSLMFKQSSSCSLWSLFSFFSHDSVHPTWGHSTVSTTQIHAADRDQSAVHRIVRPAAPYSYQSLKYLRWVSPSPLNNSAWHALIVSGRF